MKNLLTKSNIVIGVLLLIIFALIVYNIWSKPAPVLDDREAEIQKLELQIQQYETTITLLTEKADSLTGAVSALSAVNDSLESVKQEVKHVYHKIYIDISSASNQQLDSILRANW